MLRLKAKFWTIIMLFLLRASAAVFEVFFHQYEHSWGTPSSSDVSGHFGQTPGKTKPQSRSTCPLLEELTLFKDPSCSVTHTHTGLNGIHIHLFEPKYNQDRECQGEQTQHSFCLSLGPPVNEPHPQCPKVLELRFYASSSHLIAGVASPEKTLHLGHSSQLRLMRNQVDSGQLCLGQQKGVHPKSHFQNVKPSKHSLARHRASSHPITITISLIFID